MNNLYTQRESILRNSKIQDFLEWLLVFSLPCGRNFEIFTLSFIAFVFFIRLKMSFSIRLCIILSFITAISIISTYINGYSFESHSFFILSGIYFFSIVMFMFFRQVKIKALFLKYLTVAYIYSLFGILGLCINVFFGIDIFAWATYENGREMYLWHIHTVSIEPGYFATFLIPSVAYYILSNQVLKWRFLLIILNYLLTVTSIAIFILFCIVIYKILRKSYLYFLLIVFALLLLCNFVETLAIFSISNKIIIVFNGLFGDFNDSIELSASPYAWLSNLKVAIDAPARIFGTGLGTHIQNYMNSDSDFVTSHYLYGLNASDAYSLGIRIFSEFGFLGLIGVSYLIFHYYKKKNIINNSILFFLFAMLLRGGMYFAYGVLFFLFFYIQSSQEESC